MPLRVDVHREGGALRRPEEREEGVGGFVVDVHAVEEAPARFEPQ